MCFLVGLRKFFLLRNPSGVRDWQRWAGILCAAIALGPCGWAQAGMSAATAQQSGIAAGSAHAPVLDAKHRPITAGGFVDGAPVVFVDITKGSGLNRFNHRSGTPETTTII